MRTWDTFMVNDELDMLECRLTELERFPVIHVAVEADVDHQGHPKPYHLSEHLDRFSPWADRLRVVRASGLPTVGEAPGPWAREHAQREWVTEGLRDALPQDVVLHGDVDEIPNRLVEPDGFSVYVQAGHFLAVDWLHPDPWRGTVAAHLRDIWDLAGMRHQRHTASCIPEGGWHLSWLGGKDAVRRKMGSFCHPEFVEQITRWLDGDVPGLHLDGKQMTRTDGPWPRWVTDRECPADWFS